MGAKQSHERRILGVWIDINGTDEYLHVKADDSTLYDN